MSRLGAKGRIAVTACALLACATGALADVADFYRGKTVTLLVGQPPGGGYDAYTRLLARHLTRHLPGNPTVIPANMPGANGIVAANYLYNQAPKDGLAIGVIGQIAVIDTTGVMNTLDAVTRMRNSSDGRTCAIRVGTVSFSAAYATIASSTVRQVTWSATLTVARVRPSVLNAA